MNTCNIVEDTNANLQPIFIHQVMWWSLKYAARNQKVISSNPGSTRCILLSGEINRGCIVEIIFSFDKRWHSCRVKTFHCYANYIIQISCVHKCIYMHTLHFHACLKVHLAWHKWHYQPLSDGRQLLFVTKWWQLLLHKHNNYRHVHI